MLAAFQPGQVAAGVTGASALQDIAQGGPKVILLVSLPQGLDMSALGPAAASFVTTDTFGFSRDYPDVDTLQAQSNYDTQ